VQQWRIPAGSQADRLRKHRGVTVARNTVQAFAPPVVSSDAQARYRRRAALYLGDFFRQRHLGDERGGLGLGRFILGARSAGGDDQDAQECCTREIHRHRFQLRLCAMALI